MVWKPAPGSQYDYWLQEGYVKVPGTSDHFYMQYSDSSHVVSDNVTCSPADPCTNATPGTTYRYIIKRIYTADDDYWKIYTIDKDTYAVLWESFDPTFDQVGFTPSMIEYAAEEVNQHDQGGGNNAHRARLYFMRWYYGSMLTQMTPNFQGSERICDLCGSNGPFNYEWANGADFEVWTDGF
jgi:hypothetical protein